MTGVGIDVGGTKILAVAVDRSGAVVGELRLPTRHDPGDLLDELAEVYRTLVDETGADHPPLGVGVPGLVDPSGRLAFAPNLAGVAGTPIGAGLAARLGSYCPAIEVDNDATCAAAGEAAFGAAAGATEVLVVTLGTGIGGGIVMGGHLVRGAANFAGEIGHVVVDPHGPPCGCGHRGCWERYASGSGLGRLARDASAAGRAARIVELAGGDVDLVRGEHVVEAVAEGDEGGLAVMAEFAWWVSLGLANLANILDPGVIVIGGGLVSAGEALFGPLREAFAAQLEGAAYRPEIAILPALLGERSGAIGAAVIGLEAAGTR